jgi:hypothetical protein
MDSLPGAENRVDLARNSRQMSRRDLSQKARRSICLFLAAKGLNMRTVHVEVETVVHEKMVRYLSVTKSLRLESFGEKNAA